jgi:tetratricopeptide (TPR) repeat protein
MSEAFSRPRRFFLALITLFCATILFRAQIADALVIRGDEYFYRGEPAQALIRYRRAIALDPRSETATDRYVFISLQMQTAESIADAIAAADAYLRAHPNDTSVLADRALCYLHIRRYALAANDFARAAAISHSPRYALFARLSARAERT